jgi:hypothetical protein
MAAEKVDQGSSAMIVENDQPQDKKEDDKECHTPKAKVPSRQPPPAPVRQRAVFQPRAVNHRVNRRLFADEDNHEDDDKNNSVPSLIS